MHIIIGQTPAFNAVYNLASPSYDAITNQEHPIPGVNFLSRYSRSPNFKNFSAKRIYEWFYEEFCFLLEHARKNQDDDAIFLGFIDYFQVGEGLRYESFAEFCKDVDWYKLERELSPPEDLTW